MSVPVTGWSTSPLDAVEQAFALLTCEPHPLSLDLDTLDPDAGLPPGVMPLTVLRLWLLEHPAAHRGRDAVWRELIRRARLDGPSWVVAAVGMALPALRRHTAQLTAGWPGQAQDLAAEVLTGFLAALRDRVDLTRPAPYTSLCMAGWRAGYQLREREGAQAPPVDDLDLVAGPRAPRRPWGHPDLLVHRAVELGLIDPVDEQPYIDLRLGRRAIEPIAQRLGVAVDTLRRRAQRIDIRLTAALAEGLLDWPPGPASRQTRSRQSVRRAGSRTRHSSALTTGETAA